MTRKNMTSIYLIYLVQIYESGFKKWLFHSPEQFLSLWVDSPSSMGDLQDPKMEVLYHTRPYFGGISPYIGLT